MLPLQCSTKAPYLISDQREVRNIIGQHGCRFYRNNGSGERNNDLTNDFSIRGLAPFLLAKRQ